MRTLNGQAASTTTTSVLVVEDNDDDALLVRRMLGRASSRLRFAHAGSLAEALPMLEGGEHGCVLLDLSLPDADDLEALQILRQAHPDLPIVVLTGRRDDTGLDALKHGAHEYLIKGAIDAELLTRTIRYAIERAQAARELAAVHERFRRAFEDGPLGMALLSVDALSIGRVLDGNRALAEVLGTPLERLVGLELQAFGHWGDRGRLLEALDQAAGRGTGCHQGVMRLIREDGHVVWASLTMSAVADPAGGTQFAIVQLEDITRRRQDEEALREAKEALEGAVGGIARVDLGGAVATANRAFARLLGVDRARAVGRDWLAGIHPGDRAAVQGAYDLMLEEGRADVEARFAADDGTVVEAELVLVRNLAQDGGLRGHFCFARDITDRRHAERALTASERRYRSIVETTSEGVLLLDREGRVQFGNRRVFTMLGVAEAELLGRPVGDLAEPASRPTLQRLLDDAAGGGAVAHEDLQLLHADGTVLWGLVSVSAASAGAGGDDGVLVMVSDITERKRIELQLGEQAKQDALTRLPNRTLLLERIEQALGRQDRGGPGVAVLFLDIDRFKLVNDELGHAAGDELLLAIAGRLLSAVRACDTVARHGGDEFVVLCGAVAGPQEAEAVAERVLAAMAAPLRTSGSEVLVDISVGIATSLDRAVTAEELLRNADAAMYEAKDQGGARFEVYDDAMRSRVVRELALQRDLRRALEERQLSLVFQPLASLSTGAPLGFEALLRWQHPERGPVSPGEFVPLAERLGLMRSIGAFVLEETCRQVAAWRAEHGDVPWARVSVNVSAHQIADPGFPDVVADVLRRTGIPPTALILEITETALLTGNDQAVTVLEELRALGPRLFLDDFGTGFSSLSHLVRYPVDGVKIDRSFVGTLDDEGGGAGRPVVEGVIGMARALGLTVVAEGIETVEQLRTLASLGCSSAQGYLLARPLPAAAAVQWALAPPELLELRGRSAGSGETLTIQQATVALGVSASTLRRWADAGRIQVLRTSGGHRRVLASEVHRINRERPERATRLRLAVPGDEALPALAQVLARHGESLTTAVTERLYDVPGRGLLAGDAGRAVAAQWLAAVRAACVSAAWDAARQASADFLGSVRIMGGTVLEAQCFLERFGEVATAVLAREGERDEAANARRLFVALRQHALSAAP